MPRQADDREASPGAVDANTLRDLLLIEECLLRHDGALGRILGTRRVRNPLLDEVMRKIVICFGQGREETIAHYERECSPFGSRTATQRIIHDLQWAGLVFLRSTEHTRALCVIPSERLVLWYIASARDIRKLIKKRLQ